LPPSLSKIIAALRRLDASVDAAMLNRHADLIHAAMLNLITSYRARGHLVGKDDSGGFYARPRNRTVGVARELEELAPKCRKAAAGKISLEGWITIWAAQPERIWMLWKRAMVEYTIGGIRFRSIDRSTLAGSFEAHGYHMVAPKPELVLPEIEAALSSAAAMPAAKTRKGNADEAAAIAAIRTAYREITGHEGGRVLFNGKLAGKFNRLGREIDGIFGTSLFAVKDSKRLR